MKVSLAASHVVFIVKTKVKRLGGGLGKLLGD